jgi:hypothetical protein
LGVLIPASIAEQLLIQNGGYLLESGEYPFEDRSAYWTNSTVDGIDQVESWARAADHPWFEHVKDVKDLHLLITIASHSESHLCLDYRKSAANGVPGVAYVDVGMSPTEVTVIADTADEFIKAIVCLRLPNANA